MTTIFKDEKAEREYHGYYDASLQMFELPWTSTYVHTSYGDTHVVTFGDSSKPPLILLHGMTMSSTMWYPNVKQFVEERYVMAIDLSGDFGKSKPSTAIKNKLEAARWLSEVMDGLHIQSADIAGHSMGGFVALNYAISFPQRVSKLLLYAPAGTFYRMNPKFFIKIYPALLFHTERLIDKAFRWFSAWNQPLQQPVFRNQIIAGYRSAKPSLQVMPSVFSEAELRACKVPTLLLVGDQEVIYPAEKAIANARRHMPNIEAHLIHGANHALTIEHAEVVNDYSIRYLRQA